MHRIHLILITGGVVALSQPGATAGDKPNIIHIMIDDAGPGDFTSFWADSPVHTPNIDQLAADGVRFTRAYAGAANCAPSRSALLTGRHAGHTYMRVNSGSNSLRDADLTVAEMLRDAGYATGGYGKWGLGAPGTPGAPERQGFDEFVGYYDQVHAHYHFPDRLYDAGNPLLIPENDGFNEPETGLVSDARVHAHGVIFDRMQQFVRTHSQSGTPFYAWGAWTPPHRRSTLNQSTAQPGGIYDQYASEPGWNDFDKIQAAFVTWVDDQVGQLRATLADPNGDGDTSDSVAENTLIIFTSDNGGWQSAHNWDRNIETRGGQTVDLRGAKEAYFEGGLRTPMIAAWPGTIAGGNDSDTPVAFYDYLATFAELSGAESVPANDGVSFAPTLTGQGQQQQREGLYFEGYAYNPNSTPTQIARMGDWKIIRKGGNIQIFDLAADPSETTNRFNDPAVAEVQEQLIGYLLRQRLPITSQLAVIPPNVGTSNAARDGEIAQGIRPAAQPRDWEISGTGDAQDFAGTVLDQGQPIDLYLDDLHMVYELQLDVTRSGEESPLVDVSLVGQSGFTYYTAAIDVSQIAAGSTSTVDVLLEYVEASPSQGDLAGDLGDPLTLKLAHAGETGEVQIANMTLTGQQPALLPLVELGDLDADGQIGVADWQLFRQDMFSNLKALARSEARQRGDLNGDGLNNELDFALFKQIYDGVHGAGALEAVSAQVPEPAGGAILAAGISLLSAARLFQFPGLP